MSSDRTPLTELERSIATKYTSASFPPATAAKRFAIGLGTGTMETLEQRPRLHGLLRSQIPAPVSAH